MAPVFPEASQLLFFFFFMGVVLYSSKHLQTHAKVQIDLDAGMDSWYRELFGEDWMKKNSFQRRELERQAKENGENTPMRHGMPWHSFLELLLYMFHTHAFIYYNNDG